MKYFYLASIAILISSCSNKSPQTLTEAGKQYCYIEEVIVERDGKTAAESITTCTDKPRVEHFVKDSGIAEDCKAFQQTYTFRGRVKNVKGFLCRFPDGSWEAVDGRYAY